MAALVGAAYWAVAGTTPTGIVVPAGANRVLVYGSISNGAVPSAVTFGGQALTLLTQNIAGSAQVTWWYLLETGIAAAVGTTLNVTGGGGFNDAVVFFLEDVDQATPFVSVGTGTSTTLTESPGPNEVGLAITGSDAAGAPATGSYGNWTNIGSLGGDMFGGAWSTTAGGALTGVWQGFGNDVWASAVAQNAAATGTTQQIAASVTATTGETLAARQRQQIAAAQTATTAETITARVTTTQAIAAGVTATTGQSLAARQRQRIAADVTAATGESITARATTVQAIAASATATTGESLAARQRQQAAATETATTGEALAARQRQQVAGSETATTGESITATSSGGAAIGVSVTATTGESLAARQRQQVAAAETATTGEALAARQTQAIAASATAATAETVSAQQRQRVAASVTAATAESITATSAGAAIGWTVTATTGETVAARQRQQVALAVTATSGEVWTARSVAPEGPVWAGVSPLMHRFKIWDELRWRLGRITLDNGYDVEVATVERFAKSYAQFSLDQTPAVCVYPAPGQPPPQYLLSEARDDLIKFAVVLHVRGTDPDWRTLELGLLEEAVFTEINRDAGLGGWAIETIRVEGAETDEGTPERQSSADGSSTLVTAVQVRYCAGQVSSRVLKHAGSYVASTAPTVIVTPGTFVPVAGIYAATVSPRSFTVGTDGSLTYTDERGYTFRVTANLSVTCPSAGVLSTRLRVDGTGVARTLQTRSNEAGERVQISIDDALDLTANQAVQVEVTHTVAQSLVAEQAVQTITVAPFG